MTPMGRSSKRGPAEEDKPLFYIDYALPGNINMSMDFRDMLDKLTEIEKINRVR